MDYGPATLILYYAYENETTVMQYSSEQMQKLMLHVFVFVVLYYLHYMQYISNTYITTKFTGMQAQFVSMLRLLEPTSWCFGFFRWTSMNFFGHTIAIYLFIFICTCVCRASAVSASNKQHFKLKWVNRVKNSHDYKRNQWTWIDARSWVVQYNLILNTRNTMCISVRYYKHKVIIDQSIRLNPYLIQRCVCVFYVHIFISNIHQFNIADRSF